VLVENEVPGSFCLADFALYLTLLHILSTKQKSVNWFKRLLSRRRLPTTEQRAHDLIAAIDAGGLPLNAAVVNDIARSLGLEVSNRAQMKDTIARIRMALKRLESNP
jgi:energy-converting hydrogenase Eha subunit F